MSDALKPIASDALERIQLEAASWVAQIDRGRLSSADKLALAEWMARSPRHEAEIRRVAALWGDVDALLDAALIPTQAERPFATVVSSWIRWRPLHFAGVIAAICFSVAAFSYSILYYDANSKSVLVRAVHATMLGEINEFTLHDGSTVQLNTNSRIATRFSTSERFIRLERGEAHFDVSRDPNRPFVVLAGDRAVQAIGTRFIVRLDGNDLDLTVTEGRVELSHAMEVIGDHPGQSSHQSDEIVGVIDAGTTARVSAQHTEILTLDAAGIDKRTAWLEEKIIFDGDSLEFVVSELSRYSDTKVIISDPEIRDVRMGGTFYIGELDAVLQALETSLGIQVEKVGDDLVYLKKFES
ncbi:MAG: FecR domain-containing protein [Pseudomonadota bacterium]